MFAQTERLPPGYLMVTGLASDVGAGAGRCLGQRLAIIDYRYAIRLWPRMTSADPIERGTGDGDGADDRGARDLRVPAANPISKEGKGFRYIGVEPISTNLILSHVATYALRLPRPFRWGRFRLPRRRADRGGHSTTLNLQRAEPGRAQRRGSLSRMRR